MVKHTRASHFVLDITIDKCNFTITDRINKSGVYWFTKNDALE